MRSDAQTVDEYLISVDPKWIGIITKLRKIIVENIPQEIEERMNYGMIGYVIPHSIYPEGYHANPEEPLPYINLAAQKNNVSLYHMGVYGDPELERWFNERYREEVGKKPNMGKSCIRFRKEEEIPFTLIEELMGKITIEDYIDRYRKYLNGRKK